MTQKSTSKNILKTKIARIEELKEFLYKRLSLEDAQAAEDLLTDVSLLSYQHGYEERKYRKSMLS